MSVSNDLGQWYKSIPPITRTWFTGSVIVPVAGRFGLVRPQNLLLFIKPIIKNFQVYFLFLSNKKFFNIFFS
jgi:derlin-1